MAAQTWASLGNRLHCGTGVRALGPPRTGTGRLVPSGPPFRPSQSTAVTRVARRGADARRLSQGPPPSGEDREAMSLPHESGGGAVSSSLQLLQFPLPPPWGVSVVPPRVRRPPTLTRGRPKPTRRSGPPAFLPGAFPGGDGPPAAPGTHLVPQCLFGGPLGPMPIASKWVACPPCCWPRGGEGDGRGCLRFPVLCAGEGTRPATGPAPASTCRAPPTQMSTARALCLTVSGFHLATHPNHTGPSRGR